MKNCVAAIFLLIIVTSPAAVLAADINIRAGIGYEVISQEFFLDSLTQTGVDSLDAALTLSTTYLDELKGFVRFKSNLLDRRRLDLTAQFEQTSDLIRAKLYSDSRLELGQHRFQLNNELEVRTGYSGETDAGEEFIYGAARARLDLRIADGWDQFWSIRANFVDFDSSGDLSYNQLRVLGSIGLSRTFRNFSSLSGMFFVGSRSVPDSSLLDYVNYGVEANLFAFYQGGDLDLTTRLERKDYNQPNHEDDYTRFEVLGHNKLELGGSWLTRQDIDLEYSSFSDSDLVNVDYIRTLAYLQAGWNRGDLSLWAGPQAEFLAEGQTELVNAADYSEYALRIDIEYVNVRSVYGSLEWSVGVRDLRFEDEFQSDFRFQRVTVLGDAHLTGGLGLNLLLSAEWEWHDLEDEDNRLYLISSHLTYDF